MLLLLASPTRQVPYQRERVREPWDLQPTGNLDHRRCDKIGAAGKAPFLAGRQEGVTITNGLEALGIGSTGANVNGMLRVFTICL